jgi:hypothetical protein
LHINIVGHLHINIVGHLHINIVGHLALGRHTTNARRSRGILQNRRAIKIAGAQAKGTQIIFRKERIYYTIRSEVAALRMSYDVETRNDRHHPSPFLAQYFFGDSVEGRQPLPQALSHKVYKMKPGAQENLYRKMSAGTNFFTKICRW